MHRFQPLLTCLLGLVFALIALTSTPAAALTLELTPNDTVVAPSDVVTLDLVASGLGSDVLGDFDIDVTFDPALAALAELIAIREKLPGVRQVLAQTTWLRPFCLPT